MSKSYERTIYILLIWTILQDFLLGLFLNFTGLTFVTSILFYTKDALMLFLFLWSLIRINKFNSIFLTLLFLYFLLIITQLIKGLLFTSADFITILSSTRSWLLAPCFITIALGVKNIRYFKKLCLNFLNFLLIVAIAGIIEYFIDVYITSTIPFWTKIINIGDYMTVIKGQGNRLYNNLPGNFYGQYGGEFFSQKRLVSFWAGPLTAGYILSIPTIYFYVYGIKQQKLKPIIKSIVFFIAVWLTHTRAISLQLVVILFILPFIINKKIRVYYIFAIPFAFVFVFININKIYAFIYDGSTIEHIRQFTESFSKINIFGSGIGTFGVDAKINTESAYMSCFGQLGIIGLFLYLYFNCFIPLYFLKTKYRRNKYIHVIAISCIFLITGLVSEQLIAYTSIAPYYIFIGFYYVLSKNEKVNLQKANEVINS